MILYEEDLPPSPPAYRSANGRVALFQMDAVEFLRRLPPHSIDVIATDPAYSGMNNRLKFGRGRIVGVYNKKGTATGKWFAEFEDSEQNYRQFLGACRQALHPTHGHLYIMFDSFSLLTLGPLVREFFDVKNIITWDKVNLGMGHYFRRRHEYILFATNSNTRKLRNRNMPDVWRFKRIYHAAYPTQKPVEVFQAMIFASAGENFTICDPFVGSGSSAVAALKNHCIFLGADIAERALRIARDRVEHLLAKGIDPCQPRSAAVEGDPVFWE